MQFEKVTVLFREVEPALVQFVLGLYGRLSSSRLQPPVLVIPVQTAVSVCDSNEVVVLEEGELKEHGVQQFKGFGAQCLPASLIDRQHSPNVKVVADLGQAGEGVINVRVGLMWCARTVPKEVVEFWHEE